MYTLNLAGTTQSMPGNGRGSAVVARVITNATIVAASGTSVQVTDLGANVAVGDILIAGQGHWGVATSVNDTTDVVTVKKWYRLGGGVGSLPPSSGTLVAFVGGILRSAAKTIIHAITSDLAAETVTFIDALGNTIAAPIPGSDLGITIWGPWRATASAAGPTVSFELEGNLDI